MRKPYYLKSRKAWFMNLPNAKGLTTRKMVGKTKRDAEAFFDNYRLSQNGFTDAAGTDLPRISPGFGELSIKWLDHLARRLKDNDLSEDYYDRAHWVCLAFYDFAGEITVAEVTAEKVKSWLPEGSASYRRTAYSTLKACLKWAEDEGHIAASPIRRMRLPGDQTKQDPKVINAETHAAILTHAGEHVRPFLSVLWLTGARPGELSRLQWEWLSQDRTTAVLPLHKTAHKGKVRRLYFPAVAVEILRSIEPAEPTGHVFLNRRGKPWNRNAIRCVFRRIRKKGGPAANAYAYRHTVATRALAAGEPMATVAALLGHASTAILSRRYAHLEQVQDHMRQAAERLTN